MRCCGLEISTRLLLFLALSQFCIAQSANPRSDQSSQQHNAPGPKAQEQFAPYWTSEPGWHTELQLRNNLAAQSLTVIPVLRNSAARKRICRP